MIADIASRPLLLFSFSMGQEALVLFDEMGRKRLKRDLVTFNTMISSCVRANKPEKALEVFGRMADEGIGRDQVGFRLQHDGGRGTEEGLGAHEDASCFLLLASSLSFGREGVIL